MDFWSRLVGGSGRQGKQTSPRKVTPQQRLDRFKRIYNTVQQTCSRLQQLSQPGSRIEQLVIDLGILSTLLREELRSPAPYTCLSFSAANQIYAVIGRAASACKDERVILEAVTVFSILIDSEMEGFVSNRSFARALMRFSMRVLDSGYSFVSTDTESQLVEVLFNISAKIRLEPDILSVWFAPSGRAENEESFIREKKSFVGITQKDDFPLCYLFMDRVHHEGRIGDFARTGLLYIFESSSRSAALDQWIVASDLPTLMASALGALYSQLSRELSLLRHTNDLPMLLAMSDYPEYNPDSDVETISSESHKAHMATFLSDLTFWQDILDHCRSVDVKQTLLDHFQILFLQQLLYPSLLQSSDTDGGSSVAVMTYLSSILQTLTDEGLANMLLTYLLGTQSPQRPPPGRPPSPTVMRRRSSLMIITTPASEDDHYEPSLFNLVDLIHNGLQSINPQTTFAALKLFTTILTLQPLHALGSLVRLDLEHRSMPDRTVGALDIETSSFMRMAASIGGTEGLDEAFDGISYDVRKNIDAIAFRHVQAAHTIDSRNNSVILSDLQRTVSRSMLDLNNTGMRAIMRLVENFLSNSVDTNLALTETIMAICMSISIDVSDLIAIRPDRYRLPADPPEDQPIPGLKSAWLDAEETKALQALLSSTRTPALRPTNTPIMLAALRIVETQVTHLRQSLSRFDALLSKRKSILQTPQHGDLFSTPAKSRAAKPRPSTPAHSSLSRHASPAPLSKHSRQPSLTTTPSRPVTPTTVKRNESIPRGRRPSITASSPTSSLNKTNVSGALTSPIRPTLGSNVFRPPPPEPPLALSPPRMAALRTLSPSARTGSMVSTSMSETVEEHQAQILADSSATHDAETLRLRVRFDAKGRLSIAPPDGDARSRSPVPTPRGARSPVGLAGRLRGQGVPSSRGSSVSGLASPDSPVGTEEEDEDEEEGQGREVSLGHVLTNIVVLQNFILEIVAVLQLRARVYEGEVRFD
ncbi:hypothetical protein K461DRAFT_295843 [Myriangium duriaei CBS 260.36]|uniref:Retinoic acid induced 16-like protein-domain-containing protein n=1 Tax=Myriangium duriaei CBS 260.36 TaxID=1168546 RepID=A0A9P4IXD6_9PEZI|nr:hypothetical protein K461DRAFT_295843 [Myriangium duriaei CBS 260.36]